MTEIIKNPLEMSAQELYALAKKREEQEVAAKEEAVREQRQALREQRRELVRRHRKELAALDREIGKLGGKVSKTRASRGGDDAGPSQVICEIVASEPEMSIGEIRERAAAAGLNVKNISQTLGYLKKQGRLDSPRRGVYRVD
ncbi:hypothetical protein [Ectothiorhodospira lacustris]|uniref:hypothetical protein n=1 Tax=Ectothiorhodospira lacustris TaxID=2899127 RepID=UPI001EE7D19C|nr:hypothetical protein [Ectothiorhodospira lacustris]MCG5500106.1 hypothetical protein [Ectothiorhodospira lacustris]MCG5510809.1 hypothetical protein [Ectothiorhodospira lacustris]MCG5522541.1 hypothetical protein [Ectothiorhodospira lacustris]